MIGKRLVLLRKNKDLTQDQIAKIFNMSRSTYAQYEVDRRNPDYETLKMFAEYFNVSTDYLLGRTDDPSPRKNPVEIFTPEAFKKHGLTGVDLYEEAEKIGLTNEEAAEILKDFGPLYKKHQSKFVVKY